MPDEQHLAQLREHYIALTRRFFQEVEDGRSQEELQPLQEEIEATILQIDQLEQLSNQDPKD